MKTMVVYFLLTGVFTFQAKAKDSGLCEDLAAFSCSPGIHDDGTGKVARSDYLDDVNKKLTASLPAIRQRVLQNLNKPESEYFVRVALIGLGLKDAPECASKNPSDKNNCLVSVADGVTSLALSSLKGSSVSFAGDLEALDALKKTAIFDEIKKDAVNIFSEGLPIEENEKKIREKIFPQVKKLIESKINSLPIDEETKELMIMKLKSILFGGSDCGKVVPGLNEIYYPNAVHLPPKPFVVICKGHLLEESFSEFRIAKTLGHEIAHGIDPCQISMGVEGLAFKYKDSKTLEKLDEQYPIKGLASCLRSEKSIGALNKLALTAAGPDDPNPSYNYCSDDQMGEAFTDWLGIEILVDYIADNFSNLTQIQWQKGFGNVYRRDCKPSEVEAWGSEKKFTDVHPESGDRINRLLLVNPQVRKKMGCTKPHSKYIYCDASNPEAMALATGAQKPKRGTSRRTLRGVR